MPKQQDFENKLFNAGELHRTGKTQDTLAAVEQLLANAEDEGQRQSCVASIKSLRLRLEWQAEAKTA